MPPTRSGRMEKSQHAQNLFSSFPFEVTVQLTDVWTYVEYRYTTHQLVFPWLLAIIMITYTLLLSVIQNEDISLIGYQDFLENDINMGLCSDSVAVIVTADQS